MSTECKLSFRIASARVTIFFDGLSRFALLLGWTSSSRAEQTPSLTAMTSVTILQHDFAWITFEFRAAEVLAVLAAGACVAVALHDDALLARLGAQHSRAD